MELSIYKGELEPKTWIKQVKKMTDAFPTLPKGFYDILADRIKDNGFSDDRLIDAVNYVIDNCVYPQPTIAQIISFDKKVKLYTHTDVLRMLNDNPDAFKSFRPIRINKLSRPMYAHVTDIEMYKLEPWTNKI